MLARIHIIIATASSVDARSNSLVVSAPDPLFREVMELVTLLDQATTESEDTMRVVSIESIPWFTNLSSL